MGVQERQIISADVLSKDSLANGGHISDRRDMHEVIIGIPGKQPHAADELARSDSEVVEDKAKAIAMGAVTASTLYGLAHALSGGDTALAEDVVDMLHSAYTSAIAARGIICLQGHDVFVIALPSHLRGGDGPVVRMFCHSIGYFLADACLIVFEVGFRKRFPKLWLGRLAHHFIHSVSNLPSIFKTTGAEESLALCSGLCMAYFAEFSSIFLRLRNIARRTDRIGLRRALNWFLLASFGLSRLVNFPFLIRC